MKVTRKQEEEIAEMIRGRADEIAGLIARAVEANATHCRPANVGMAIKVARNTEKPTLIEVVAQEKTKVPKNRFSDTTSWNEAECIVSFDTDEVPGQQRIGE